MVDHLAGGQAMEVSCKLHKSKNPTMSLEKLELHTCDKMHSGTSSHQLRLRFCKEKEDLTKSDEEVKNNPNCCTTNQFGYYNMDKDGFYRNMWQEVDGNTNEDDGGDELGQCEGYPFADSPMLYFSVQNEHSDMWCVDQMRLFGNFDTPKVHCTFGSIWSDANQNTVLGVWTGSLWLATVQQSKCHCSMPCWRWERHNKTTKFESV